MKSGGKNEATEPLFKCELTMDITNQIYTKSLLNPGSTEYQLFFSQVSSAVSFTNWLCLLSKHRAELNGFGTKRLDEEHIMAPYK